VLDRRPTALARRCWRIAERLTTRCRHPCRYDVAGIDADANRELRRSLVSRAFSAFTPSSIASPARAARSASCRCLGTAPKYAITTSPRTSLRSRLRGGRFGHAAEIVSLISAIPRDRAAQKFRSKNRTRLQNMTVRCRRRQRSRVGCADEVLGQWLGSRSNKRSTHHRRTSQPRHYQSALSHTSPARKCGSAFGAEFCRWILCAAA